MLSLTGLCAVIQGCKDSECTRGGAPQVAGTHKRDRAGIGVAGEVGKARIYKVPLNVI